VRAIRYQRQLPEKNGGRVLVGYFWLITLVKFLRKYRKTAVRKKKQKKAEAEY
jgi:hypothetical protein